VCQQVAETHHRQLLPIYVSRPEQYKGLVQKVAQAAVNLMTQITVIRKLQHLDRSYAIRTTVPLRYLHWICSKLHTPTKVVKTLLQIQHRGLRYKDTGYEAIVFGCIPMNCKCDKHLSLVVTCHVVGTMHLYKYWSLARSQPPVGDTTGKTQLSRQTVASPRLVYT
jgi:hypothetical protein